MHPDTFPDPILENAFSNVHFYIVIFLLLLSSYIVSLVCEYTAFSILAVVQRQTQYHHGLGNLEGGCIGPSAFLFQFIFILYILVLVLWRILLKDGE